MDLISIIYSHLLFLSGWGYSFCLRYDRAPLFFSPGITYLWPNISPQD